MSSQEHGQSGDEAMAQKDRADVLGLFCCPACEWAATTGATWQRCPHCDTTKPPVYREYVPR